MNNKGTKNDDSSYDFFLEQLFGKTVSATNVQEYEGIASLETQICKETTKNEGTNHAATNSRKSSAQNCWTGDSQYFFIDASISIVDQPRTTMSFNVVALAAAVANTFFSVVLILLNKQLITKYHFTFMTVLSGMHFATSFVVCLFFMLSGTLKYKVGSLLSVVFMNYCLSNSSIGFYQVAKLSCIPFTIIFERILGMQQESLSPPLLGSLALIILGMSLIIREEITTNLTGFIWGLCGVITTALSQVFFAPLKKNLSLDAMQLLFHTAPWLTFGSFLIVPVFEDTDALVKFEFSSGVITGVLLTCFAAVAYNVSNYVVLAEISPLSYNIMGHVKTIVIISVGSYMFNTIPSSVMLWGMTIAIVGVLYFTYEKDLQTKAKVKAAERSKLLPVEHTVDVAAKIAMVNLESGLSESGRFLVDAGRK